MDHNTKNNCQIIANNFNSLLICESATERLEFKKQISNWIKVKQDSNPRVTKLEKVCKFTRDHYNKKSISFGAKLRHYNTVVQPELYAAETTLIQGHTDQRNKSNKKPGKKLLDKFSD